MHRVLLLVLLLVGLAAACPFSDKNDDNATGRLLTGKVLDNHDNPLPGAVVHLTNLHSRAVKTFFARRDGTYRFPGLSFNVDYEVHAQFKGEVSETETLNKSGALNKLLNKPDEDRHVNIVLRIDVK